MKMKAVPYAKFQEKYSDEFIARKDEKVLAHAKTYRALKRKIEKMHLDRSKLVIGLVPPKNIICIYHYAC
jgi:hypothetical protein